MRLLVPSTRGLLVREPSGLVSEPTYSISELNELVRDVLRRQFPRQVWVRGEIKGFDLRRDRRWVSFRLAEKSSASDDVLAEVAVILAPDDRQAIEAVLRRAENAFHLQDGIEVRFRVEVDLWVKAGLYQLRVRGIDPTFTLGRLAQNRKRLLELLARRGLLRRNRALALPLVPLRVGLIAAKGSAGYTDFVTHVAQSGLAFRVVHLEAAMQGPQVEAEVSEAVRLFNRLGMVEVIVITRGGGGATDLSWFDRLTLAEAIATSRLPVLTGLGHTYDRSVADEVAHATLKTPTDAAQFLIDRVRAFLSGVDEAARQLGHRTDRLLHDEGVALVDRGRGLVDAVGSLVSSGAAWLADRRRDLTGRAAGVVLRFCHGLAERRQRLTPARMQRFVRRSDEALAGFRAQVDQRVTQLLLRRREAVTHVRRSCTAPRLTRPLLRDRQWLTQAAAALVRQAPRVVAGAQAGLHAASEQAAMLDPLKTLRRGFSVTRTSDGTIVTRIAQVGPRERLMTQVSDGTIESQAQAVVRRHEEDGSHG